MICPFCEGEIGATAKKCRHCGEWVVERDEAEETEEQVEADHGPPPSASHPTRCGSCGVWNKASRSYCRKCIRPFLLLGLVLVVVAFVAWRPTPAGVWHDDGVYLLVGKALAEGNGLHYTGVVGAPPAVKFPPLYSGVLAVLWFLFGEIGAVTLAAQMLNLVLLGCAGALMAWALHVRAGLEKPWALAAGLLAFVSADVLRFALIPLSEPLFMLFLMGTFAAWPVGENGEKDRRRRILVSVLMILLVLTRSAAIAPIVGCALALLWAGRVRSAAVLVGPAVLVASAWGAWATARAAEVPDGMRDVLGPYTGWLSQQLLGDPVGFVARLPTHAWGVVARVATLFVPGVSRPVVWFVLAPLLLLGAVGARGMHRRFPPFAWTAAAYFGLLLLWPYVDSRLVAPLHPFLVTFVLVGAVDLGRSIGKPRLSLLLRGAVVGWVGAYTLGTASRIASGWPVASYQTRAAQLAPAIEALGRTATAESIVGAPEFWPALHLHAGWTVTPSALFRPARREGMAPMRGTPDEQLRLWRAAGVSHLLLENRGEIHGEALDSLEARCPGSVELVAVLPPQMVVRTHWTACPS
jgi:hypothetical protein